MRICTLLYGINEREGLHATLDPSQTLGIYITCDKFEYKHLKFIELIVKKYLGKR